MQRATEDVPDAGAVRCFEERPGHEHEDQAELRWRRGVRRNTSSASLAPRRMGPWISQEVLSPRAEIHSIGHNSRRWTAAWPKREISLHAHCEQCVCRNSRATAQSRSGEARCSSIELSRYRDASIADYRVQVVTSYSSCENRAY